MLGLSGTGSQEKVIALSYRQYSELGVASKWSSRTSGLRPVCVLCFNLRQTPVVVRSSCRSCDFAKSRRSSWTDRAGLSSGSKFGLGAQIARASLWGIMRLQVDVCPRSCPQNCQPLKAGAVKSLSCRGPVYPTRVRWTCGSLLRSAYPRCGILSCQL